MWRLMILTLLLCRLMSDYEVTLVNDNVQEFYVRFHGPEESTPPFCLIWSGHAILKWSSLQHRLLEESGRSTSSFLTSIHTSHPLSASWTRYFIRISTSCMPHYLHGLSHKYLTSINRSGSVCLDVINQTWSPMFGALCAVHYCAPKSLLIPN